MVEMATAGLLTCVLKLMANGLAGQEDTMDIKMFSKERYKTGKLLLEPAVV